MSDDKFECQYDVEDGYVGGDRPLYFNIFASDIEEDMNEDDLVELFQDEMQGNFDRNIAPGERNQDSFVEWAKGILSKKC